MSNFFRLRSILRDIAARITRNPGSSSHVEWPHDHPIQFVADTNLLLQCNDMGTLDWSAVTDAERILVIIAEPVQIEIDRLKSDGNSRRSKRARKANTLLRSAIQAPNCLIAIRTTPPMVDLALAPAIAVARHAPDVLDLSRPDDAIIAEALALQKLLKGISISILTHDTNPLLTAKRVGAAATAIPDSWLLPPEPDDKDKRIRDLEARVEILSSQYPVLKVCFDPDEIGSCRPIQIAMSHFPELDEVAIRDLLSLAQELQPPCRQFNIAHGIHRDGAGSDMNAALSALSGYRQYRPASDKAISQYRDVDYPEWVNQLERWLRELHKHLQRQAATFAVEMSLLNLGTVPANNLLFRISVSEGFLILPPEDESGDDDPTAIPPPPAPPVSPKGRWEFTHPLGDAFRTLGMGVPQMPASFISPALNWPSSTHDPYHFYWRPHKPVGYESTWELECDEFRHQAEPEVFAFHILAPGNGFAPLGGTIEVCASAANLPEPLRTTIPILVHIAQGDTAARARACLLQRLDSTHADPGEEE